MRRCLLEGRRSSWRLDCTEALHKHLGGRGFTITALSLNGERVSIELRALSVPAKLHKAPGSPGSHANRVRILASASRVVLSLCQRIGGKRVFDALLLYPSIGKLLSPRGRITAHQCATDSA